MSKFHRLTVLLCSLLCILCLGGCTADSDTFSLTAAMDSTIQTLDPIYAQSEAEQTVLVHLYENLMKRSVDAEGNVSSVYGIAKSVEQETNTDDTVTCTFRLRSAKWSDGKAVRAEDFVFAWQRLIDPANESPYADLLQIVCGYDEARESGDTSLLQVTAKNDSTLIVTLSGNYDWFLNEVCTAPATMPLRRDQIPAAVQANAEEAVETTAAETPWWSDVTALVGNGSYLIEAYDTGSSLTLCANEAYYHFGSQSNPTRIVLCLTSPEEGAALYESGQADVLWPLTDDAYTARAAEETPLPTLSTDSLLFNTATAPFQDQAICQAVVKALDRNALAAAAGVTAQAADALVSHGVPDANAEDFRSCAGALIDNDPQNYAQNCAEAVELLRNAGYESGADLGTLTYLYVEDGTSGAVARELCRQLQSVLSMDVTPQAITAEELDTAFAEDSFTMAGKALTAHCNDAESFLLDWVSDSPNNVVHFTNTAYDTLMSIIATAPDGTARLGCLHDAEELLISDAPLTPLYTTYTFWTLRPELQGALRDARGWFSFSGVTRRQG